MKRYTTSITGTSYSLKLKQLSTATVFDGTQLSSEFATLMDNANGNGSLPVFLSDATKLADKGKGAAIIESAAKTAVSVGALHSAMSVWQGLA